MVASLLPLLLPLRVQPRQSKIASAATQGEAIVSVLDVVRKGLGYVLMSMGVSSPAPKKPRPAVKPAPDSKPQP